MRIKELLCVGSLAASILTAGCSDGELPTSPDLQPKEVNASSEKKPKIIQFSDYFRRPVRVFYVEDSETDHLEETANWIWDEVEKSRKFFANEMNRHGYRKRTFRLKKGLEKIKLSKPESFYRGKSNDPKELCNNENIDLRSRRLAKEMLALVDNPNNLDLHIYIINFQLQCVEGVYLFPSSLSPVEILIDAHDPDILYEIIAHELGHAYGLEHIDHENNLMNDHYVESKSGNYKIEADQAEKIDEKN